ncbi:MAG TPA: nuclear transport factor 2 family protein [Steroidobacteraceae bacterium]|jgi:hypothetical protein
MRRTLRLVLIFLVWGSAAVTGASAGSTGEAPAALSPAAAQAQVLQLEEKWLASETDPEALESILADDFIHVLKSGFISKQDHIAYWRAHPVRDAAKKSFDDLRVRIFGNVGIATGIVVHEAAGKIRKTAFTDVFAYREGKWQAVNAQELLVSEAN